MTTSTNMHLGYEWMRPTLANDNRSDVLNSDSAYYFTTSSNLGEQATNRLDSLSSTTTSHHPQFNVNHGQQQQQQQLSGPGVDPRYKYANDLMLGMYQSGGAPAKLQEQQHATRDSPFAGTLGEQEGKMLAGSTHSNDMQFIQGQDQLHGAMYARNANDGIMHQYKKDDGQFNERSIKEQEHDFGQAGGWVQANDAVNHGDQEDVPAWGSINKDAVGTFDSNGVFRPDGAGAVPPSSIESRQGGGDIGFIKENNRPQDIRYHEMATGGDQLNFGAPRPPSHSTGMDLALKMDNSNNSMSGMSSMLENTYKWLYRDPQGNIQGPFGCEEMQDWFKAGFFAPTLMIRREDQPQFEPLIDLVRKTGDDKEPFRTANRLSSSSSALHSAATMGMPTPHSAMLSSFHPPTGGVSSTGLGGSVEFDAVAGRGHYPGNILGKQPSDTHGGPLQMPMPGFGNGSYPNSLGVSSSLLQQSMARGMDPGRNNIPDPAFVVNRGSSLANTEQPRGPSWLNNEPFAGGIDSSNMGPSPYHPPPPQYAMNPHLASQMGGSPGFLEYQRAMNEYQQQQQHMRMLQQQNQEKYLRYQQQYQPSVDQRQPLQPLPGQQQLQQPYENHPPYPPFTQTNTPPASTEEKAEPVTTPSPSPPPPPPKQQDEIVEPEPEPEPKTIPHESPISETVKDKATTQEYDTNSKDNHATVEDTITKPLSDMQLNKVDHDKDESVKKETRPTTPTTTAAPAPAPAPAPALSEPNNAPTANKPVSLRDIQAEELDKQQAIKAQQEKEATAALQRQVQDARAQESQQKQDGWMDDIETAKVGPKAAPWELPAAPKKTLRQIQQEEEEAASKMKAKKAAAGASSSSSSSSSNNAGMVSAIKGYANATEGSTPKGTTTSHRPVSKTTTSSSIDRRPLQQSRTQVKQVSPSKSTIQGDSKPPSEEFMRWCRQSLRGLNRGVNVDEIVQMLLSFPLDASSGEIIQDIIYANSTSMDGRRFANEFIKSRKEDIAGKFNVTIPVTNNTALDDGFKLVTKKGKKKTQT
ncbi:hypothetical protein K492DRAFT_203387 [Lichtheimia hyalospora FSU 10163]|nr:hypothetical protein K492DRAFT_203387 [Lichtheimia hyalospora FSU 10163]